MKRAFYILPKIYRQFTNCLISQIDATIYTNTVLGDFVSLSASSTAIETTFPLSNFKTKYIFGTLMALRKCENHLGRSRCPKFFIFLSLQKTADFAAQVGRLGRPKFFSLFPKGADHRRAREQPPKAAVARVYILILYWVALSVHASVCSSTI